MRRAEYPEPGRVRLTYAVENNAGRDISRFTLTTTVKPQRGTVTKIEASSDHPGTAMAFARQQDASGVCTFEVQDQAALPDGGALTLTCAYETEAEAVVTPSERIVPEPFVGDEDYDQVNDELERQVAEPWTRARRTGPSPSSS